MASPEGEVDLVEDEGSGVETPEMAVEGMRREALNMSEASGGGEGVEGLGVAFGLVYVT
jgi:hypothetical protein